MLVSSMNIGLHEGMKALVVQESKLYRRHTHAPPAPGTESSKANPTINKLRALAEEGE